jgi:hypothetical protein
MKKVLLFLSCFIQAIFFAQQPAVRISKDVTLIGKPFDLIYSIELEGKDNFQFSPQQGTFKAKITQAENAVNALDFQEIEILKFSDTIVRKDGKKTWIGMYELCAWDSGLVVLEGQQGVLNDSTIGFSSAYIKVNLVEHEKGRELFDIKESFLELEDETNYWDIFLRYFSWWVLPLVALLIFYFVKKKKNQVPNYEPEISLREKTLTAIKALEKAELWRKNQIKEHFVELSFILRSYLTARYDVNLLDKTTSETRILLKAKGLDKELLDTISRLLNHADMVKFAASEPTEILIEKSFHELKQLVIETSPLESEHVQ